MELLGAFLLEFLVPFVLELLGWIGIEWLAYAVFEKPLQAITVVGAPLLGGLLGWMSLTMFPEHLLQDSQLALLNLGIAPLVAACGGGVMALLVHPERELGRALLSALTSGLFVFAFVLVRWLHGA
jgi:hypothetical protein